MMTSGTRRRVAVIGAGGAGLITLRHFVPDANYDIIAYETQNRIGGIWNYPEGCEQHPDAPETSSFYCRMTRDLRANTPKDLTRFRDLQLPAECETFVHRNVVLDLIREYAEKFNLSPRIKFRHRVVLIEPFFDGQQWMVKVEDLDTGIVEEKVFDNVIICNGHYNKPYLPIIPGMEIFQRPVIHSSAYRTREMYKDKVILVIGANVSANEVICELLTVAKKVIVGRKYQAAVYPAEKFPNILETTSANLIFKENGVILPNGSFTELDGIILCTGYQFDFPFLSDKCRLEVSRGRVTPLYRHLINPYFPSMAIVGLLGVVPFIFFGVDDQVQYYKAVLDGKVVLPSCQEMLKDVEMDYAKKLRDGEPEYHAHRMFKRLWPYCRTLAQEAGFPAPEAVWEEMFTANIESVSTEPYDFRNYLHFRIDSENSIHQHL